MTVQQAPLPAAIQTYQAAHDRHDVDAALATFTTNAVVHDDGKDWVGITQIQEWLSTAASAYTFTRTFLGLEQKDAETWLVRNRLEGNFPGGVVELRYEFTLKGELISGLRIAP